MKSLHVLLVEDDEDHVFLVRRALRDLEDAAVTVDVAGNGERRSRSLGGPGSTLAPSPSWCCWT
jgi:CheY-like chemotaxis protein